MPRALLEPYLDHLRALPFARAVRIVPSAKGQAPEAYQVAIRTPDCEERLRVELKTSHLSADLVERWAGETRPKRTILFVPAVGRDLGDRLEQLDVPFVDRAGNCYVNLSDRYVSRIQGRRAAQRPAADKGMRAPAYRALFALLADPGLAGAPIRTLAEAAAVSRQAAADILPRLQSMGLAYAKKKRFAWTTQGSRKAIDLFIAGYSTTLRPQLALGRFRTPAKDPAQLEQQLIDAWRGEAWPAYRWGGGAAAMRLTGHYHGPQTVLHVDALPADLLKVLKAIPDKHGPLEVLGLPGPLAQRGLSDDTVHPLLVYAELLREQSDRARETAQDILDRWLTAERLT